MAKEKTGERVPTGVPGFDEMIEGGFERGSTVIVSGESGSGKTTLAMQFIVNGAKKFNEAGLYITFEEHKGQLFAHMKRYGWDLAELEKKEKLSVIEYQPHEVERFILQGSVIEDMVKENKIKRVVIDSLTSFVLLFESEYKRRQEFIKAVEVLRSWGCTTMLTSEGFLSKSGVLKTRFGMEFLADAFIAIHTVRRGDSRENALEVVKMRGTAHERKLVPMKITTEGVVLYPNEPVFNTPR